VDFKNTVIIMTSNLGAQVLNVDSFSNEVAFEKAREQVMDVLRQSFRPEFLNRVDDIVIFRPLGEDQLVHIIDLRLADLKKLLVDRKIAITLTDAAKHMLFTQGYDRAYGARPLKRALQKLIQDPLAMKILDGEILHGDEVKIDADKRSNTLTFEVTSRAGIPLESHVTIGRA